MLYASFGIMIISHLKRDQSEKKQVCSASATETLFIIIDVKDNRSGCS